MQTNDFILILDFGSQYNQLIARRVREHNVFCKILPHDVTAEEVKELRPKGIILSGGPASVYDKKVPGIDQGILELGIPILGICYGMQVTCHQFKGKVAKAKSREYGYTELQIKSKKDLFKEVDTKIITWMSHGDHVSCLPKDFQIIASSKSTPIAACANRKKKIFCVQFHPEVAHTQQGSKIIKNFLHEICECRGTWTMQSFIKASIKEIQDQVGNDKVVLGLSGGVDSSVAAALLHRAIGNNLTCIFVDNGLLRKDEGKAVREVFGKHLHMNIRFVNAKDRFLKKLAKVVDPEKKRKIIGHEFISVFDEEAKKLKGIKYLAQGTLYPDLIESKSAFGGPSVTIKSHHNVGGLPKKMKLKLVEPLKELFKDEVRVLGKKLGLSDELVWRHPFPGPGLAVRIIGDITEERTKILQEADAIFIEEIRNAKLYRKIWQAFAVLLPIKTVGVMGDKRTYENVVALRAVSSTDGMTADWSRIPYEVLAKVSNRIINEIDGINRVTYDISSKPPATIEWE